MRSSTRHRWIPDATATTHGICKYCSATYQIIHCSPGSHKLRRYTLRSGIIWTGAAPPCDNIRGYRGPRFDDHWLRCYLHWWYDYSSSVYVESNNPLYLKEAAKLQYPFELPVIETHLKTVLAMPT